MSPENIQTFLQSASELSLTNGQHAFFILHTHAQLNPDVFLNLIGSQDNTTEDDITVAMEAVFLLVAQPYPMKWVLNASYDNYTFQVCHMFTSTFIDFLY